MNCPVCNSAMQSGEACIARLSHGLVLDLLMALGGGSQAATDFGLYFQSRGEQGAAVPIDQLRRVFHCSACLTTVIAGPDPAGPKPVAEDWDEARKIVKDLDDLLAQGRTPTAVRRYREIVGVTWDEALAAMDQWRKWPAERKEIPIAWAVPRLRQAGAFP